MNASPAPALLRTHFGRVGLGWLLCGAVGLAGVVDRVSAQSAPAQPERNAASAQVMPAAPAMPAGKAGLAVAEKEPAAKPKSTMASSPTPSPTAKQMGDQIRQALEGKDVNQKQVSVMVDAKGQKTTTQTVKPAAVPSVPGKQSADSATEPMIVKRPSGALANPLDSRNYLRSRAAMAKDRDVHWGYEGEIGPKFWSKLKPEFNMCAAGKRQSPINIEDSLTLQGPAEPILINYSPSSANVINNGHTILVEVMGENSITVRASTYKLLQFHFHHPSEERINGKPSAMVAHLVHRNAEGQLAVLAVLMDPGLANLLIHKVWTFMPLEKSDRVSIPSGVIDLNELLPKDMRYYQFMGSLTTPPCTEGVLWLVLKQPVTVSPEQLKLFGQLFPNNARPVQPLSGRIVREAQ
jgi:carbonic anhydrase